MFLGSPKSTPALPKRTMRGEKGQALPLALIALALASVVIAPFLGQAGASLITSRDYKQAIIKQYSADAGVEHALWRLKYEPGFASSLTPTNPVANYYTIAINGTSVNVTVTFTLAESPPVPPPPPSGEQSGRVLISKSVTPCSGPVGENSTFTYTISVSNNDTSTIHFDEIGDLLPSGFSYVPGSSNIPGNLDAREPMITVEGGRQKLLWGTTPPHPSVGAGGTGTQSFQAWAVLENDIYWDESWVKWTPAAVSTVGTGSTAPVGGGGCPFGYDIIASASGTTISTRTPINNIGGSILFWQIQ